MTIPINSYLNKESIKTHDQPSSNNQPIFYYPIFSIDPLFNEIVNNPNIKIEGSLIFKAQILDYFQKLCKKEIGRRLIQKILNYNKPLLIKEDSQCTYLQGRIGVDIYARALFLKMDLNDEMNWFEQDAFFGFCHELIHFLHFLEDDYHPLEPATLKGFPNLEEQYTITGLGKEGHINPISEWAICKAFGDPLRVSYYDSEFSPNGYINETKADGFTRLHEAILVGALGAVKDLISRGADLTAVYMGKTPYELAIMQGETEMADLLEKQTVLGKKIELPLRWRDQTALFVTTRLETIKSRVFDSLDTLDILLPLKITYPQNPGVSQTEEFFRDIFFVTISVNLTPSIAHFKVIQIFFKTFFNKKYII